ncbi:hypothetical protein GOODEAATRI_001276, partial [Goodea atripinnis]
EGPSLLEGLYIYIYTFWLGDTLGTPRMTQRASLGVSGFPLWTSYTWTDVLPIITKVKNNLKHLKMPLLLLIMTNTSVSFGDIIYTISEFNLYVQVIFWHRKYKS